MKTNNQWSGTLGKLPAVTGRTFSAEAFNSSGTKLYAGSATGAVLARQTTTVSITLQEVNPPAPFANAAPVITSLSAAPGTVEPGGTVVLTASASDANAGDTLTSAWSAPSGSFAQSGSLSTSWTAPSAAATVPLTLTVTDSKGATARITVNVNAGKGHTTVNASLNTWPQVSNISASATALEVNESTTVSISHTVALRQDGTVWAWGHNTNGQLGDGTLTQRAAPVQVPGLSGVTAIATGDYHTLTLRQDGTVWAWGYNGYGQLGDGTTTDRSSPVRVSGLSGVTTLAAGSYHTLALRQDGTLWAWGSNLYNQLGDGTTADRTSPEQVQGL